MLWGGFVKQSWGYVQTCGALLIAKVCSGSMANQAGLHPNQAILLGMCLLLLPLKIFTFIWNLSHCTGEYTGLYQGSANTHLAYKLASIYAWQQFFPTTPKFSGRCRGQERSRDFSYLELQFGKTLAGKFLEVPCLLQTAPQVRKKRFWPFLWALCIHKKAKRRVRFQSTEVLIQLKNNWRNRHWLITSVAIHSSSQ